jgi:hypothetical protein
VHPEGADERHEHEGLRQRQIWIREQPEPGVGFHDVDRHRERRVGKPQQVLGRHQDPAEAAAEQSDPKGDPGLRGGS